MISKQEKRVIDGLEILGHLEAVHERMNKDINSCTLNDPRPVAERVGIPQDSALAWFLCRYEQWQSLDKAPPTE